MKKATVITIILLSLIIITACRKKTPPTVTRWFDCRDGDEIQWNQPKTFTIDDFPQTVFHCTGAAKLEAIVNSETKELFIGMPIWSVYFYDLTGDGKPEICSSASYGSGLIDERIIVYDYVNQKTYVLADRGQYDYILFEKDNSLYVKKNSSSTLTVIGSGKLAIINDALQMLEE